MIKLKVVCVFGDTADLDIELNMVAELSNIPIYSYISFELESKS